MFSFFLIWNLNYLFCLPRIPSQNNYWQIVEHANRFLVNWNFKELHVYRTENLVHLLFLVCFIWYTVLIFWKTNHNWYNLSLNMFLICSYFWKNFSLNGLRKSLLSKKKEKECIRFLLPTSKLNHLSIVSLLSYFKTLAEYDNISKKDHYFIWRWTLTR